MRPRRTIIGNLPEDDPLNQFVSSEQFNSVVDEMLHNELKRDSIKPRDQSAIVKRIETANKNRHDNKELSDWELAKVFYEDISEKEWKMAQQALQDRRESGQGRRRKGRTDLTDRDGSDSDDDHAKGCHDEVKSRRRRRHRITNDSVHSHMAVGEEDSRQWRLGSVLDGMSAEELEFILSIDQRVLYLIVKDLRRKERRNGRKRKVGYRQGSVSEFGSHKNSGDTPHVDRISSKRCEDKEIDFDNDTSSSSVSSSSSSSWEDETYLNCNTTDKNITSNNVTTCVNSPLSQFDAPINYSPGKDKILALHNSVDEARSTETVETACHIVSASSAMPSSPCVMPNASLPISPLSSIVLKNTGMMNDNDEDDDETMPQLEAP